MGIKKKTYLFTQKGKDERVTTLLVFAGDIFTRLISLTSCASQILAIYSNESATKVKSFWQSNGTNYTQYRNGDFRLNITQKLNFLKR